MVNRAMFKLDDEGIAFFTDITHDRKPDEINFSALERSTWKTSEQKRPMDAACESAKIKGVTFHICSSQLRLPFCNEWYAYRSAGEESRT